ncbi:hypothetical protein TRL7639_00137 [Falsiruegeria litorea R37]|uniref:Uncharacterized protein n=1 Tax=Falsiruegeria litorea R37 TaxID=1200284 RepID=A0A1Y5REH0_9RHOB|nr:hypothetical protein TRL7639_00137 [Falsiruegeria litorea R37]
MGVEELGGYFAVIKFLGRTFNPSEHLGSFR